MDQRIIDSPNRLEVVERSEVVASKTGLKCIYIFIEREREHLFKYLLKSVVE
jgi:hypothetical protein